VGQLTLEVFTNVSPTLAESHGSPIGKRRIEVTEAGLPLVGCLILLLRRKKHLALCKVLFMLLMVILPILGSLGLSGCSSGSEYYNLPNVTTPVGTTVFTLTATSSNGSVESIPITLIVGAAD
jgi:hypothetical protein